MMHWQKCPKCDGQGAVSYPPYMPAGVQQYATSATSFVCDVCHGMKVLLVPAEYRIRPFSPEETASLNRALGRPANQESEE